MNHDWRESSSISDISYISGGYKPVNHHRWGPGVRDVYALHYIISGRGTLETGGQAFPLEAGESFIIIPHKEVYYYPDSKDPWEYVWVEFNGADASSVLELTRLTAEQPVTPPAPQSLQPLFHLAWNPGATPFERLRSDARLQLLLSYYMEFFPREPQSAPKDYVWQAKKYIEHNFWNSALTVTEIVQAVSLERSYLFRVFKEATGQSVSGYIASIRIRRACELLQASGLPVQSVAYSVGFNDPLYFSKAFKKATSHTPSAYRMLHAARSEP